jgi:hypothetical protein
MAMQRWVVLVASVVVDATAAVVVEVAVVASHKQPSSWMLSWQPCTSNNLQSAHCSLFVLSSVLFFLPFFSGWKKPLSVVLSSSFLYNSQNHRDY